MSLDSKTVKGLAKYTVVTVTMLLLSLSGLALFQAKREERRATLFLSELRKIKPGISDFQELMRLSARFEANRRGITSPCDQQSCTIAFDFDNRLLSRLHLAPYIRLGAGVETEADKVVGVDVNYDVFNERGSASSATVLEFLVAPDRKNFTVMKSDIAGGKPPFTIIRLTPDANAFQEAVAFDFNLRCLSRLGGCPDAKVLSPSVWRLQGGEYRE